MEAALRSQIAPNKNLPPPPKENHVISHWGVDMFENTWWVKFADFLENMGEETQVSFKPYIRSARRIVACLVEKNVHMGMWCAPHSDVLPLSLYLCAQIDVCVSKSSRPWVIDHPADKETQAINIHTRSKENEAGSSRAAV